MPSPHSIDLVRTPTSDYLYRQARTSPHVAELYHENSKLTPYSTLVPKAGPETFSKIRAWFFDTAYDVAEGDVRVETPALRIAPGELPGPMAEVLDPFAHEGPLADLLYGTDLLVLSGEYLFKVAPTKPYLYTERCVKPAARAALERALGGGLGAGDREVTLFVVACPWRYMFLAGPRGYRHTLLDVGRVLHYFEALPALQACRVRVVQDFHDSAVDRFCHADGLERSVYAVLQIDTTPA